MPRSRRKDVFLLIFFSLLCFGFGGPVAAEGKGWPREKLAGDGIKIKIYQPQVDSWEGYVELRSHMAIEFFVPGFELPLPAAVSMSAETTADFDSRTVVAYNLRVLDIRFPSVNESTAKNLTRALEEVVPSSPMEVALDRLLAYYDLPAESDAETDEPPAAAPPLPDLRNEPPEIVVSHRPAVLVLFDGEPIFVTIEGTELQFAVNTNWDILNRTGDERYYLLYENGWLEADSPLGPWEAAEKLPKEFRQLPDDSQWQSVREQVPGAVLSAEELPHVYVSSRRAELIVIEGEARLEKIPGTRLQWATNTDSDLFLHETDRHWYLLVSGRWFRSKELDRGPWSFASDGLPDDFAAIPGDHVRAAVRVSVPGTPEAEEAVRLAGIPRKAEVRRDEVTVQVVYSGDPEFVPIDGTSVAYAANTSFDVLRVGDLYYTCFQGVWFVSSKPDGAWDLADSVPDEIYGIPPSCPKHHVTYVHVYDSTPEVVVVGYTSGYWGVYVSSGYVVYGTGYYWPPYYYRPPYYGYPVYYPYPYSYGVAAWYNPYTGMFGSGAAVYGPYGGYGWGAAYNPNTGTYARGAAAYGPYQAGRTVQAYNPSTGTYAAGYQRANAYQHWGESVVRRDDDWVHTGHYGDSRGTVGGFETSKGGRGVGVRTDEGSGFVARDADNNVYAGKDGNVYKNDGGSWSQFNGGEWQSMDPPEAAARAREDRAGREAPSPSTQGRSSGTYEQLQRDRDARSRGSQRTQDFNSWRGGSARGSGAGRRGGRRR